MKSTFVVAFNRNRDFYQVPLALHEHGLLSTLVTDIYHPTGFGRLQIPKIGHRQVLGLPSRKVSCVPLAIAFQLLGRKLGMNPRAVWERVDSLLASRAAECAAKERSNLFLYSQYALEAFTDARLTQAIKGLFVFHPHHDLARKILLRDLQVYPGSRWSYDREQPSVNQQERCNAEIAMADFIVCASTFTKRSLVEIGYPSERVSVVPYGTSRKPRVTLRKGRGPCKFLFVGQGIQRKGLHHLLRAWKCARIPGATLTLVCSVFDPGYEKLIDDSVTVVSNLSRRAIDTLYSESHVFAMPSLVEGFGLVYLEALAAGCHIIATRNTGVPDLDLSPDMRSVVEAGDVPGISAALVSAYEAHNRARIDHSNIACAALKFDWSIFRSGLVDTVNRFCPEVAS